MGMRRNGRFVLPNRKPRRQRTDIISVKQMAVIVKSVILSGDIKRIEYMLEFCRKVEREARHTHPDKMPATRRFIKALEEARIRVKGGGRHG